jgi:hypothetical protein
LSIPTAPKFIFRRQEVSILLDPLLASAIYAARTQAEGHSTLQRIGLVALAIGWTGAPKPWLAGLTEIRDAAAGQKAMYESEMRGRGGALTGDELRELKRDLVGATDACQQAEAALRAADIRDLPLDLARTSLEAAAIQESILSAGVPALRLSTWVSEVIRYCDATATAGYSEWMALEEAGFSIPPAEKSSSGGSKSPDASVEMLPAGSR